MQANRPHDAIAPEQPVDDTIGLRTMRSAEFRPRRSVWPGLLVAGLIAAGIGAVVVTQYGDDSDTVQTASVAASVADSAGDAAITAAVKTALAADPALSTLKIDVTTQAGAVLLEGPAPDESARQRAAELAAAPKGVARVDNNLVVQPAATGAATPASAPTQ